MSNSIVDRLGSNFLLYIQRIYNYLHKNKKLVYSFLAVMMAINFIAVDCVFADDKPVNDEDVTSLRERIVSVTKSTAFPIGGALIFVSVALIAIKIIVAHYNPNARSQAMEGLKWVAIGAIILGSAIIIANIMINLGQVGGGKITG